jgi:hypothetical protein
LNHRSELISTAAGKKDRKLLKEAQSRWLRYLLLFHPSDSLDFTKARIQEFLIRALEW